MLSRFVPLARHLAPEWMDAPDVDPAEHRRALAGLRRINALSGAARSMRGPVLDFIRSSAVPRVRLLDVASGGGDVPITLACAIRSIGVDVELTLFDQSDVGLSPAVDRARSLGISAIARTGNAIEALPYEAYHIVTCSLFLHHLSEPDAITLLSNMRQATAGLMVVNDLLRSRAGWLAAWAGCHVLSRSPLVHHDGPASVRAAWTPGELNELARRAGLDRAVVCRCWPFRMRLTWLAVG